MDSRGDGDDDLGSHPNGSTALFGGAGNDDLHQHNTTGQALTFGGAGDDSLTGCTGENTSEWYTGDEGRDRIVDENLSCAWIDGGEGRDGGPGPVAASVANLNMEVLYPFPPSSYCY